MGSTCIITDNSAQFTHPGFPGHQCLQILHHNICYTSNSISHPTPKVNEFPRYSSIDFLPVIQPPTSDSIYNTLSTVLPLYDDIFIILLSKEMSPLYEVTEKIAATLHGHANLHVIDSQNISLGLGLIVQYAAELSERNLSAEDIEKSLRLVIPHIYTLFCTPNLSYLNSTKILDKGQSIIGEMLSLYPLFVFEEGHLNPLQKVKNQRNAIEYFLEFVDEFDDLRHVAVLQPSAPAINETKLLRQHIEENFPNTSYSEHLINPFLASYLGPRGFGLVIMENIKTGINSLIP